MTQVKQRFSQLLKDLKVRILTINLQNDSIEKAMTLIEGYAIDMGDALNYFLCEEYNIRRIVSNDKDWQWLPDIILIQPTTDRE